MNTVKHILRWPKLFDGLVDAGLGDMLIGYGGGPDTGYGCGVINAVDGNGIGTGDSGEIGCGFHGNDDGSGHGGEADSP